MITKSINILNLNIPCHCHCRYCLLEWNGKTIGVDYDRSVNYAKSFYKWLKENRPDLGFTYYFGYSMEHPKLFEAIKFMQETNSPGGEFLQFDGMKERTKDELVEFLSNIKSSGIKLIDLTFYGLEEYHDKFAARQGDYNLMMNTLEVALNLGLNVEVGIPVTKENLNQLNELVEIFSTKNVDLYLFTPHSIGRGKTLLNSKITVCDYESMNDNVKKYFKRENNRTQKEWLDNPPIEVSVRTLTLSLLPSNIDDMENKSFEEVILELEEADDYFYSIIPSFNELLKKYVDVNDSRLYSKKDLYFIYRKKFVEENNLKIKDITDERFSGSFRY